MPPDYVLYEMSYVNVIMYSAVLPSYKPKEEREKRQKKQKVVNVDNPNNRDKVRQLLDSIE